MSSRSGAADGVATLIAMVQAPTVADGGELISHLAPALRDTLVPVARMHGIEAWLAACARGGDQIGDQAAQELGQQRANFQAARMRTTAVIEDLTGVFDALGCPWLVLKGPAVAQSVYPRPDLRFGVDLDVLVPPARFGEVLRVLADTADFTLVDVNWPLIESSAPGELRITSPRGVLVDLHWSMINTESVRSSLRFDTDELLARRRNLDSGLPVLAAEDQLAHLGAHGALSGANKLSWLLDADLAARQVRDWSVIVDRCQALRTSLMLAVVLGRAKRVWRTPVPTSVLRKLAGGVAPMGLNRMIDALSPVGPDPDLRSVSRAWARAVRTSTTASVAEIAGHGVEWLRDGRSRARPTSPITDSGDRRSPMYPVADLDARDRYLTKVAAST